MSTDIIEFVDSFVEAIKNKTAAIFAGAGLSQPAGFVNWKDLLKKFADELKLDIEEEKYDLISLAQFYENEKGNRSGINKLIMDNFQRNVQVTDNHLILARLPIQTYWTTNYDVLIEKALESVGKTPDVKVDPKNLAVTTPRRDVDVFKMHGDINRVHETVFTRNDYEKYHISRKLFSVALRGDLVSKTFLFIGFSFNDPNLNYILSRIRLSLENNVRTHYCFFKTVKKSDCKTNNQFITAKEKQKLRINDLKRYGIQTIEIDNYNDLTNILRSVEERYKQNTVFISGSAEDYSPWLQNDALKLMHDLSYRLVENELKIISGFGWGIGSAVINGALQKIYSSQYRHIEEYLILRPFPQFQSGDTPLPELWEKYRNDIINEAGISLFFFGNKKDSKGNIINAEGVKREFDISVSKGAKVIPVGATGFMSEVLWKEVRSNFENYYPGMTSLKSSFNKLGDKSLSKDPSSLLDIILDIINKLNTK